MQEVTGPQEGTNSKATQSVWPDLKESKIELLI